MYPIEQLGQLADGIQYAGNAFALNHTDLSSKHCGQTALKINAKTTKISQKLKRDSKPVFNVEKHTQTLMQL